MSDFNLALAHLQPIEGGYSNDPNDSGGATNWGISLRFYRTEIDPNADENTIRGLSKFDAENIYKKYFWERYGYSQIMDDKVATKVFEFCVNCGASMAHKCLQRAIWSFKGYKCIDDDGILGIQTIGTANLIGAPLIYALRSECAAHYQVRNAESPGYFKRFPGLQSRGYA